MSTVAYLGNFGPANSTENDLARALRALGHTVITLQEEYESSWLAISDLLDPVRIDLILWTRTASLAARIPHAIQRRMQYEASRVGVPTVGYHLDRWWDLSRESDLLTEPFFRCSHVFTADGGHDEEWFDAGVNHTWMPPAIAKHKVMRGSFRDEFAFDIAFVGSWQGGYHEEWQHRPQMIDHLRNAYREQVGFFPRQGDSRIDGADRADLFFSSKIIVGDSCLVPKADGTPMHHYCSDRVFETVGQGGLLLHPYVEGILGTGPDDILQDGVHCVGWTLWNWDELDAKIAQLLALTQAASRALRRTGFEYVRDNHTYHDRMEAMMTMVLGAPGS